MPEAVGLAPPAAESAHIASALLSLTSASTRAVKEVVRAGMQILGFFIPISPTPQMSSQPFPITKLLESVDVRPALLR